jgi:dipeptidyl aminopeptidase/acylaminoacyl peptidase
MMSRNRRSSFFNRVVGFALALLMFVTLRPLGSASGQTQETYKKPPPEILEVLHAPVTPQVSVSPTRDFLMLMEGVRYPPIADLAQPMLRVAGLRINPKTNGPHRDSYLTSLVLVRIADGAEIRVALPERARPSLPRWSPDGRHFAFLNTVENGIELWIGETATGRTRRLVEARINAAYGEPFQWMPDARTLLVQLVPEGRGRPPEPPVIPVGPNVQEGSGRPTPVRTYQDLLRTPHDEAMFEYYARAQLAVVDIADGRPAYIGSPDIFQTAEPSPDGRYLLVARVHRPYSYLVPHTAFPKEVEVWDRSGRMVYKLASLPLHEHVPIEGVPTGPREYTWRPTEPATLVWVEALDEGDPRKQVPHRDRVLMLKAPFTGSPIEVLKLEHRFAGLRWGEKGGWAFVSDYDRRRRWVRTFLISPDDPTTAPRLVWSRNMQDRYNDPGTPVLRSLPNGQRVIQQDGDWIFLIGTGASPEGERPFLDRFHLKTLTTERLFRCDERSYETVIALLRDDGTEVLTRRETPTDPPNYYVRTLSGGLATAMRALTRFPDPTPQLRKITKQLVTYQREDGVQLSFTLYLPPGYTAGTRLPTVVWAYPIEFTDPAVASQVTGSPHRFLTIQGPSPLFFVLAGYAVLDNVAMPVVGDPETVNNTFLEQIVMNARAAIRKAVEMGVTDPDRVGVAGHSYGAFMTANLLAHSDLFRAGIARSGAYNRTLTPFGFQNERRTLWEAPDLYIKVSPLMAAHKINEPLLLIHGEADNNPGTFPIQSERMYHAVRGNGGTVRLVMLPYESHGYVARESVEHVLYEMLAWFDKYVKNAPPRERVP